MGGHQNDSQNVRSTFRQLSEEPRVYWDFARKGEWVGVGPGATVRCFTDWATPPADNDDSNCGGSASL